MRLFDTHCHFDFDVYKRNFNAHLSEACLAQVERFLVPSVGPSNWVRVRQLADDFPAIYSALGFHPCFLAETHTDQLKQLDELLDLSVRRCVAVGECGLDGKIDIPEWQQETMFIGQLELAKNHKLPLILHGHRTQNRLLQLLKRHKFTGGGILHAFSGSYQQAMQFVELGFYIGVGGVITYPRANKTRKAVSQLDLDCIVLETDAPDMPIKGHQGLANHPKYLPLILSCLSELNGNDEQLIANTVWNNSLSVLNIDE
ncbi:TatD family hydrolase [Vibrio caribbeanicus]|uniref:Uncharacterized protein n=1 Tax=Vibrio caribbeanicus ATCC BAA-2122 TaxID=796620 RepID=E3BN64_9VIBR|nr:TatD family hydrolase [Vibrio caribbeanicus]EFP95506.1 hypothetical protein VIBC2010_17639 [Vibrio caribbeanicus ATCC BAA-2122]